MRVEVISKRDRMLIRRMVLLPGEVMPWHTDVCERFTVVVGGNRLRIEFRDGGEGIEFAVRPGIAEWDAPELRVHRAINVGTVPYEEVVTFHLGRSDEDPQPAAFDGV